MGARVGEYSPVSGSDSPIFSGYARIEGLPAAAITAMIAETIDLVIHQRLERGTNRRVVQQIFEVTGVDGDIVCGQDLFVCRDDGLESTGIRPRGLERLLDAGWPDTSVSGIDLESAGNIAGNGRFRFARQTP